MSEGERAGRFRRGSEGQSLIETAFVLPVAILFTFGILILCIYASCYIGGSYACRAAVRYAMTNGSLSTNPCTAASLQSRIKPFLIGIPSSSVTIAPTWSPNNNPGGTVTIKVTFVYVLNIPFAKATTLNSVVAASGVIVE